MSTYEFTLPNGFTFRCRPDTSDQNSATACCWQDEYNLRSYDIAGKLVFDIGSHIGGVAVLAAALGALVVAVEPVPENAELVRANATLNSLAILVIEGAAGTDKIAYGWNGDGLWGEETSRVHTFVANTGLGLPREGYAASENIDVPQVTLASLIEAYGVPYLMKLDCEGGEWSVLAEPEAAQVPYITGEYHPWAGSPLGVVDEFRDMHSMILDRIGGSHDVTFPDPWPADTAGHFVAVKR